MSLNIASYIYFKYFRYTVTNVRNVKTTYWWNRKKGQKGNKQSAQGIQDKCEDITYRRRTENTMVNEERTGLWLQQTADICCNVSHIYSVTVN